MKAPLFVLFTVIIGSFTFARAQTTDELWQVVTDKLQAAENDNFYLLIGNESGVAYTFQKGTYIRLNISQKIQKLTYPKSNYCHNYS
jgi:hypothetical protein